MKFLVLLIILSTSAFASKMRDDIQSFGQHGDEVTVTFSSHNRVHRIPAGSEAVPCLENAWKSRKPVDVVVNDKSGNIIDCRLAPKKLPGARGY